MRGRKITLVGADGSGKSSISQAIQGRVQQRVTRVYLGANPASATHMLPTTRAFIWVKGRMGKTVHHSGPPDPERLRERPSSLWRRWAAHTKSMAMLGLVASEEVYRFTIIGWAVRRGHLVVIDRHPLTDYYAAHVLGTRGWRRMGDRAHGALIQYAYPQPGRIIVLDAPAEELFRRKPEGTIAALEARRQEYRELVSVVPDLHIVDVDRPLQEVLNTVVSCIDRPTGSNDSHQVDSHHDSVTALDREGGRVVSLLQLLEDQGVPVWLDRGWGVDALAGRISRSHGDLDLVTAPLNLPKVIETLTQAGWAPTDGAQLTAGLVSFTLEDPQGNQVEIRAVAEALEPDFGASGNLHGHAVPCVEPDRQLRWRTHRKLTRNDMQAIRILHRELGVPLPAALAPLSKAQLAYKARRAARSVLTLGQPDQPLPQWTRRWRRKKV